MKLYLFAILAIPAVCMAQTVTVDVPPYTSMSVSIDSAPASVDPQAGKCGMVASLVKAIANQREGGMTKKQQMKILGESNFNRFWVDRVYAAPKVMTPQDMRDVVYEQCMEQGD